MVDLSRCDTCINSRNIICENGFHPICCLLSAKKSLECITGEKDHYIKRPASRVNNVDEVESEAEDTTLIRVGDIVISDVLYKKREIVLGITTGVDGNPWASLYSQDYPVPQMMPISSLEKTGEHIDVLGFLNNALKNTIKNAANIEEDEVHIPDRITLNPDRIESGSLNFETKMYEKCLVFAECTSDQDYSIRFFDNTEVKKSWIMHMTEKQFKGMAIGMAHMLGLEITGDKENDQV